MVDRYNVDGAWETGFGQMTIQYLQEVNQLNTLIVEFNEKNPHAKAVRDNIDPHWQRTKTFMQHLAKTPSFNSIVKWPGKNEMTSLRLIVRDPCYL